MKRLLVLVLVCVFSGCLHAQVVDATVCDILKNPKSFDGKIVRLKGTVTAGFDQFIIKGTDCSQHINGIWLSYPEGTKAKAGPAALLQLQPARNFAGEASTVERKPVSLENNKDFKQFDSLLAKPHEGSGMCLGCTRYEVSATLVGRLDGTEAQMRRNGTGKIVGISGFGNLNAYSARLVLQSVSDVVPQEIDYSKPAAVSENDSVATAPQTSPGNGPTSTADDRLRRAIDALGKPGEDNGVEVNFSGLNEATTNAERKSAHDSPDGVQFNCAFDPARTKGDAMALALAHMGEHIADLRNPQPGSENAGLYELEYSAWTATVLSAVSTGQKTLMLRGGYILLPLDRSNSPKNELPGFLTNVALLTQ